LTDIEFEQLALAVKAAYPNSNVLPDKYSMKVWYRALADLDFRVAENAVWEHISTSVFPPSIAEIREKCTARLCPVETDWGSAWEEVQRAIRHYGFYREEEATASLSRLTAAAVRRMGFRNLCLSENQTADRAHFQRIYESLVKREIMQSQLPEFVGEERERLVEANTPSVPQIEARADGSAQDGERSGREYVERLMEAWRVSMAGWQI